ncbi:uncharacterized protein LOC8085896 [Sorghum bicolor]|uniref:uncharacterized protein LOC8085896 n=1 Tax=Sorghum bicolor TaxID=4558 RepID=UPI000B4249F5|nr:uncharacterized protein LOC8085896 [Sorghum bicolor]|eukprot:XP_021319349.1 uncharacterized protein LOC8085896 [Sorghum bicolor]
MDIVISAVASELVSRFISFVSKQYSSSTCLKQNLEELQRLLLRAHTIVEEADGRYVSNSGMLAQLRTLTEAMFRGYDVLDTCTPLEKLGDEAEEEVESAVRNLETTVASMAEFVVLLTGCERRMSRSPYSSYLYIDNFMFGRQVEKQQVISILTTKDDDDDPSRSTRAAITVLPIIGGCRVGKKTLVGNICSDDRIRSCYPCILHFSGDEIQKIDEEKFSICRQVRTLVTVEFASDVADEEWLKFQSLLVASTGRGSKVIIISRLEKLARFGTVSPVRIGSLSREEYRYLFKVLAFGSADPADHPRLALLGRELATVFRGSLVMLNVYASVLRSSLSVRLWTRVLDLFRAMARRNLAVFGEHPTTLLERDGSAVDITGFSLSGASFRLVLVTTAAKGGACASDDGAVLPTMSFGDIIAGAEILPDRFRLVWESRLPPYTVICANCAAEKPHHQHPVSVSPRRNKRQKLCM